MKRYLIAALILVLALSVSACGSTGSSASEGTAVSAAAQSASSGSVVKITPEEAKERLDGNDGSILIDVRTVEEYTAAHIHSATVIPYDVIGDKAAELLPDKDAKIIVYCHSGRRSGIAAQTLSDLGYTQISDLGGIQDWPYETESGAPQ